MTNIHGIHRPANAAISNDERDSQKTSHVWGSIKKQLKKLQEPNQEPTTKYDDSSIRKDDTSSIISNAQTLVTEGTISQQKTDSKS